MYNFSCEHCDGAVRERRVEREALRHKQSFVILEDVPIGVCEKCGSRLLRRVHSPTSGRDRSGHEPVGANG